MHTAYHRMSLTAALYPLHNSVATLQQDCIWHHTKLPDVSLHGYIQCRFQCVACKSYEVTDTNLFQSINWKHVSILPWNNRIML